MKNRFLTFVLTSCIILAGAAQAQAAEAKKGDAKAPPPKSAADLAFDAFNKERTTGGARDQARFKKVIDAGIAFLATHATHWRVNEVVNALAFYPNSIDKKEAPLRVSYLSNLKLEVTNLKYKDGVNDAAKAAAAAVDAAIADFEVRDAFSPAGLANYREKIDALNDTAGTGRFLVERERSYVQMLAFTQPPRAEALLKTMLTHQDKGVAGMARAELNLLEVKKAPFALSFTGLDGKPTDLAQLRGKVVAVYFWSSTNKGSRDAFEGLKRIHSDYRKKGFEVVTVSYDKEEDRAKLTAAIKEDRIAWPVHFDGKGAKTEWAAKLNITGVPTCLVIDQKGMLQHTMQGQNLTINLPLNQLEGQVKRLLGVK
jgi:cytochrome oxidase Cu insertion factor (SCO1/SenC/PrrC family)